MFTGASSKSYLHYRWRRWLNGLRVPIVGHIGDINLGVTKEINIFSLFFPWLSIYHILTILSFDLHICAIHDIILLCSRLIHSYALKEENVSYCILLYRDKILPYSSVTDSDWHYHKLLWLSWHSFWLVSRYSWQLLDYFQITWIQVWKESCWSHYH